MYGIDLPPRKVKGSGENGILNESCLVCKTYSISLGTGPSFLVGLRFAGSWIGFHSPFSGRLVGGKKEGPRKIETLRKRSHPHRNRKIPISGTLLSHRHILSHL